MKKSYLAQQYGISVHYITKIRRALTANEAVRLYGTHHA